MVTQGKLLRVLQDQNFQRVGGKEFIQSNARVIAATNCSLASMVKDNKFREDLYYRLQVVTIQLPALSERRSDIPLLARYFAQRAGFETLPLSKEAEEFLMNHEWPGNVRELENSIQRALLLSRGSVITIDHLHVQGGARDKSGANGADVHEVREGLDYALDQLWNQIISQQQSSSIKVFQWLETELAKRAMVQTGGNQGKSAKLLGISRNTLRQRLGL